MQAFPTLYNDNIMGCMIPMRAYGGHMAPMKDTDVTLALMDGEPSKRSAALLAANTCKCPEQTMADVCSDYYALGVPSHFRLVLSLL
jgi:hypothetical protein